MNNKFYLMNKKELEAEKNRLINKPNCDSEVALIEILLQSELAFYSSNISNFEYNL